MKALTVIAAALVFLGYMLGCLAGLQIWISYAELLGAWMNDWLAFLVALVTAPLAIAQPLWLHLAGKPLGNIWLFYVALGACYGCLCVGKIASRLPTDSATRR